jgi:hypothetical protein
MDHKYVIISGFFDMTTIIIVQESISIHCQFIIPNCFFFLNFFLIDFQTSISM